MLIDHDCNPVCDECQDILSEYFIVDDEECECVICGKKINNSQI